MNRALEHIMKNSLLYSNNLVKSHSDDNSTPYFEIENRENVLLETEKIDQCQIKTGTITEDIPTTLIISPEAKMSLEYDICTEKFKQRDDLVTHIKDRTIEKPLVCEICKKDFSRKSFLIIHKRIHATEKPFKCAICKEVFRHEIAFLMHAGIHTGEKPFECANSLNQKTVLNSQKEIHTVVRPYKCAICMESFKYKFALHLHKEIHSGEKPFKNVNNLNQKTVLNSQKEIHTIVRPYKCAICMESFKYKFALHLHKEIHNGEKPFECSNSFNNRSALNSHKQVRTGKKPVEHEFCKKIIYKEKFIIHKQKLNTVEGPFKCAICNESFKFKFSLLLHKQIHTGERPFESANSFN